MIVIKEMMVVVKFVVELELSETFSTSKFTAIKPTTRPRNPPYQ